MIDLNLIKHVFLIQILITLFISGIFAYTKGLDFGISAILGGMICILPSLLFAVIFFKNAATKAPDKIAQAFYWAEAVKLLIFIILLSLVLQWSKLKPVPLFIVFISAQLAFWAIPWLTASNKKKK